MDVDFTTHKSGDLPELASALQHCIRLEQFRLSGGLGPLNILFDSDVRLLTSLSVHNLDTMGTGLRRDVSDLLTKLKAGKLREFFFSGNTQSKGTFESLVRKACALERVLLSFSDRLGKGENSTYRAQAEDAVAMFFLQCPKLRQLLLLFGDFDDEEIEEGIANLCCRVRLKGNRHLYVRVNGVEYHV